MATPGYQAVHLSDVSKGRRLDVIGTLDATGAGFTVQAVSVTDTATALPTTPMSNRKAISVRNWSTSAQRIYVGGSDVTTATGYPVQATEGLPFNLSSGAELYGIADTGETVDVRVIEINNN